MNPGNWICAFCGEEILPGEHMFLAEFRNPTYGVKNHRVYVRSTSPGLLYIHSACEDGQRQDETRSLEYDKTLDTPIPKPTIDRLEDELLDRGDYSDETPTF